MFGDKVEIEDTYLYDILLAAYSEGWEACLHTNQRLPLEDAWEASAARKGIHNIAHSLVDASGWPLTGLEGSGATLAPVDGANGSEGA